MSLLRVSSLAELPNRLTIETSQADILIVRVDQEIYAIEDRCSHGDVPLSEGEIEGCLVECWLHGSSFDVRNGAPTCLPATVPVRTFPVVVSEEEGTSTVFLEIG